MSEHERWSQDAAAYALGALEADEAAEFERHMESCERCRSEVRWFGPAVEALPESVPRLEPPPQLRERLMDTVGEEAREAARARKGEGGRLPGWLRGAGRYGWRPLAGLAAVALLLVAFAGYEIGSGGGGGGTTQTTITAGQAPGVTAAVQREGDSAELRLANVEQLPEDRVLEAWVQRDGEVEPVEALFAPDRKGHASTMIADMNGVEAVMVTAEPSGGSETPTSSPIVEVQIPPS